MKLNLHEIWMKYAKDDLNSASALLKEGIYNMTCFHSQQTVEKSFKSLIAFFHKEIPRTHNLIRLQHICEELLEKEMDIDEESLLFLNDVYIDSRYPADFGIFPTGQPTKADAERAFMYARKIFNDLQIIISGQNQ